VVWAIAEGRRAAVGVDRYLMELGKSSAAGRPSVQAVARLVS